MGHSGYAIISDCESHTNRSYRLEVQHCLGGWGVEPLTSRAQYPPRTNPCHTAMTWQKCWMRNNDRIRTWRRRYAATWQREVGWRSHRINESRPDLSSGRPSQTSIRLSARRSSPTFSSLVQTVMEIMPLAGLVPLSLDCVAWKQTVFLLRIPKLAWALHRDVMFG